MSDDLDRSFDEYDRRKRAASDKAQQGLAGLQAKRELLKLVRDSVIRPVMERYQSRLRGRGHAAEIGTRGSPDEDRRIASGYEPYIQLKVFLGVDQVPRGERGPHIRFVFHDEEVELNATFSDGEVSEVPRTRHSLSAINEGVVNDEVKTWLAALLSRSS